MYKEWMSLATLDPEKDKIYLHFFNEDIYKNKTLLVKVMERDCSNIAKAEFQNLITSVKKGEVFWFVFSSFTQNWESNRYKLLL